MPILSSSRIARFDAVLGDGHCGERSTADRRSMNSSNDARET
jgi:hypothetical protein